MKKLSTIIENIMNLSDYQETDDGDIIIDHDIEEVCNIMTKEFAELLEELRVDELPSKNDAARAHRDGYNTLARDINRGIDEILS